MAAEPLCKIDGCGKIAERRGWCVGHYKRWLRHADPIAGGTATGEPEKYFRNVVLSFDGNDCLTWPYSKNSNGYAQLSRRGRPVLVSRLVCEANEGPPPTRRHGAAHSCGNGHLGCVTKRHLRWATNSENQMDRVSHRTSNRGERHGQAKLNRQQVVEIRGMAERLPASQIARLYGVSIASVSDILKRRTWRWL